MVANGSHWLIAAVIAKLTLCCLHTELAQIRFGAVEGLKVAQSQPELMVNIRNLCVLSVLACLLAGVVVPGKQAIASDHACQIASSIRCGFRWRFVRLADALDEVVDGEIRSPLRPLHRACGVLPSAISEPAMIAGTDHAGIIL